MYPIWSGLMTSGSVLFNLLARTLVKIMLSVFKIDNGRQDSIFVKSFPFLGIKQRTKKQSKILNEF